MPQDQNNSNNQNQSNSGLKFNNPFVGQSQTIYPDPNKGDLPGIIPGSNSQSANTSTNIVNPTPKPTSQPFQPTSQAIQSANPQITSNPNASPAPQNTGLRQPAANPTSNSMQPPTRSAPQPKPQPQSYPQPKPLTPVQNQAPVRPQQTPTPVSHSSSNTNSVPQQSNVLRPQTTIPANNISQAPFQTRPAPQPQSQPSNPIRKTTSIQDQKYLNPNNFRPENRIEPKTTQDLRSVAKINESVPIEYNHLVNTSKTIEVNTYDVLKLSLYIIPGLSIFILLLNSIKDKDVLWHSKQSLLTQCIWLFVLFVINLIPLPLIRGEGLTLATLWNLGLVGVLIFTGAKAYLGEKYRIPFISDIGARLLEDK